MVNSNGNLVSAEDARIALQNRGYAYGDALFETMKVVNRKILFWEDHYFRLMASMRILRMEIPMSFTMDFLRDEVLKTLEANDLLDNTARVRINVNRVEGGLYTPSSQEIDYHIVVSELDAPFYTLAETDTYQVDLFKDHYVVKGLLSTLKTNNKVINVLGSIYARENGLQNCLLLNHEKMVVEALNGNIFLVKGNIIKTPPLEDGCLKGILRKQLIDILGSIDAYELQEASISPFELQKADELFITNVISGIVPIKKYRKKTYEDTVARELLAKLNVRIRLA